MFVVLLEIISLSLILNAMLPVNRINPAGKVYFAGNGIIFGSDPMWNTINVDL